MKDMRSARLPVEYIYLDGPGIESLHAQIVDAVETSRTMTTQRGVAAKVGAGLRLKNFMVRLLSGLEGEASAEVTGSRAQTEQSTRVQTVEHRLERVINFLSESGGDCFFTNLSDASRCLQTADSPVFINIHDSFNAPQFYGGALGADAVNATGYLLLEKGGADDYSYGDDYYKQSTAAVKLSASVEKMRAKGAMGATSHEAVFIRGFAGRHVPLCVFGTLSGTSDYMQIKPYAIWK
jgi:hypothetical protein